MNKTDVSFRPKDTCRNPNPDYVPPGCDKSDTISRSYAIEQIDMAIAESADADEKLQFERFKDFIQALPSHRGIYKRKNGDNSG